LNSPFALGLGEKVICEGSRSWETKAMVEIKRLGCVSVLIGIAGLMGYSRQKVSDYVAPSEAVPRGKAPKMQVQLLNTEPTKQYAVIFYQGDEAFSGLLEFAEK
jgi:hypothetical protein